MRGWLQHAGVVTTAVALGFFVMIASGCSEQDAGSGSTSGKAASDGHSHDHDAPGHSHDGREEKTESAKKEADDGHGHDHDAPGHSHGAREDGSAAAETSAIAQKMCPVMDEKIDPEVSMVHDGRTIYFCCKKCVAKFQKEPAKYLAKLDKSG